MFTAGIIIFIIGGILLAIGTKLPSHSHSNSFSPNLIDKLLNHEIIDKQQQTSFLNMQHNEQMLFLQEQLNQLDQQQRQMLIQQMDDMQQQEIIHFMQTGVEFGGINTDLNLNPMQQDIVNQQNDNMNNTFGGPGAF